MYKGFCKQIIRMASHLAPEPALAITTEALRTTLAASAESTATLGGATVGARQQRLEAAVMVAEVRLP